MRKFMLACLVLLVTLEGEVYAQLGASEGDNYIVVIGAFSTPENANRFVRQSQKYSVKPVAELNSIRNLYYVYVLKTADKTSAVTEAERLRVATPYADTWVFNGTLGELIVKKAVVKAPVITPVVEEVKVVTQAPASVDPVKQEEDKIQAAVKSKNMTLKKGATERLDYIYFFRDAAVLRPESRFEVDHLVRILKENPSEDIIIHGHTNGNDKGKIIKLKEGTAEFFSMDNTVEDYGSAEELSKLRATVIRDYLVFNGINMSRMSIKAWGGKKPLFKEDDEKAEANVRVEIEVLNND